MDVVTFDWTLVPMDKINALSKEARRSGRSNITLGEWLEENYDAKIKSLRYVTMTREKYTEFYLKWL